MDTRKTRKRRRGREEEKEKKKQNCMAVIIISKNKTEKIIKNQKAFFWTSTRTENKTEKE